MTATTTSELKVKKDWPRTGFIVSSPVVSFYSGGETEYEALRHFAGNLEHWIRNSVKEGDFR